MADYGQHQAEKFAQSVLQHFYERSLARTVTNSDYEGTLGSGTSAKKVNILSFDKLQLKDYSKNTALSPDIPQEIESELIADQQKAYYFEIDSVAQLESYIEDPEGPLLEQANKELLKKTDQLVLQRSDDVAAGNRVGDDHTDGTVEIDASGNVTGSSTNFTSDMEGRGFKADGHNEWYRVDSVNSSTDLDLVKDLDDNPNAYDGGSISAGSNYEIEAADPVSLTPSNIYQYILQLGEKLDNREIPDENRWLVLPPVAASVLQMSDQVNVAVPTAYESIVQRGMIARINGFNVMKSTRLEGDNSNGFHIIAAHRSWQTMAMAMTESEVEQEITGQFGERYKGLNVYGSKVADRRRIAGSELFATFDYS